MKNRIRETLCLLTLTMATSFLAVGQINFSQVTGTTFTASTGSWTIQEHADVDGDGDQDIVAGGAWGSPSSAVKLYLNNGAGVYTEQANFLGTGNQAAGDLKFGDMDGDGDIDIVVVDTIKTGPGTFDIDKRPALYKNNGSGSFTKAPTASFSSLSGSGGGFIHWDLLAIGDLNGDNHLDVAVTYIIGPATTMSTTTYLNDGTGSFTQGAVFGWLANSNNASTVELVDIDGDMDLDLVNLRASYQGFVNNQPVIFPADRIYKNDGNGVFTLFQSNFFVIPDDGGGMFMDYDNDGDPDLVSYGSNQTKVFQNDGAGTFTALTTSPFTTSTSIMAVGDVDGDGDQDLLGSASGAVHVEVNNGSGVFTTMAQPNIPVTTGRQVGMLFNMDGDMDLDLFTNIISGPSSGAKLYKNGTPAANELKLEINTDNNGNQTTWQLRNGGTTTVVASGGPYANNGNFIETIMVPDGCYDLEVFDSGNDGMCCANGSGNFVLRTAAGQRIVISDGKFTSSAKAPSPFCLPMGTDKLITSRCDKLDYLPNDFMIASGNPDVAAQHNVNNANSGYQFWMYALDGSYNRFIFFSHANPVNGAPSGPMAAGHLRFSAIGTLPVPQGKFLNVRVRGRVNGTYKDFGPACSFKLLGAPPACPLTQLLNNTNSPNHSCGVTKAFGKSDKLVAKPVPGANRYRFRFEAQGSSFVRNISPSGYALGLKWTTLPLQNGTTYNVKVAISKDGGTTYCPYGQTCTVMIVNPPVAPTNRSLFDTAERAITLFPNPNNGEQLNINLRVADPEVDMVLVRIIDPLGRTVHARNISTGPGTTDRSISLDNMELSSGTYIVQLTAGEETFTERLVRQ